ncbi:MAG: hypothetical protein AAF675_22120, partial [Pseudomonadota bacterium]
LLALSLPLGLFAPAVAQDVRLTVELNKLEDAEGTCRSYFLFRNPSDTAFAEFEMALAIMDPEGVIDQLLTIDAAPVPAGRTTLKLFEIPGRACAAVGELLLHDIAACRPQNAEPIDCFEVIELRSRASAALVK